MENFKSDLMKNLVFFLIISTCLLGYTGCEKKKSERFKLLTTPVWTTDSLLANGVSVYASGPYSFLLKFKGDAKFKEDGTGYFGIYKGEWRLNTDETEITIVTDSLPIPLICDIVLLNLQNLKITTAVPDPANQMVSIDIRMTFKNR
jgi:hypothetical protein